MEEKSEVYICTVCGFTYDEKEQGIPFEELPEQYTCPICHAPKEKFSKLE